MFYYVRFYLGERKIKRFIIYSGLKGICISKHMLVNFVNICVYIYMYNTVILFKVNTYGCVYVVMPKLSVIRGFLKSVKV